MGGLTKRVGSLGRLRSVDTSIPDSPFQHRQPRGVLAGFKPEDKSLGLVVPVLQACLQDPRTTAFFVYPLRALANDQLSGLAKMSLVPEPWVDDNAIDLLLAPEGTPIRVARYDGSVLEHQRKAVRASARIVVTTPDSLHASILRMATRVYSDRTSWSRIFQGLRFVVLDEVHSYQGVFGSAVAQVLRRVRRTAARYGARPQFLAASATIGNPAELTEKLTGAAPWELVDNDGSPRRKRTVLVCNPPLLSEPGRKDAPEGQRVDLDEGVRVAPQTMAIELIASAALASEKHPLVRTICFTRLLHPFAVGGLCPDATAPGAAQGPPRTATRALGRALRGYPARQRPCKR